MKACPARKLMFLVVLAVVTVATFTIGIEAQSSICNVPLQSLMNCVPAVKPPNPQPPTPACCKALRQLKPANYRCLCGYKDSPLVKSLGIDIRLALKLPAKCGIKGAPSHC